MPVKLILQLSARNLFRYPRRNGLLLLAIAFALAGATFTNALMRGWQYDMLDRAVENLVGHVKAQPRISTTRICRQFPRPKLPTGNIISFDCRMGAESTPAVLLSERSRVCNWLVQTLSARHLFGADLNIVGEIWGPQTDALCSVKSWRGSCKPRWGVKL